MRMVNENQSQEQTQNGNKKILGIPCGCDNRKEVFTSGAWQIDAMILAAVLLLIGGVILVKNTSILED